ncbi:bifunctional chorismate mutase/prephenate dehydrogenase [Desulfobacterales bacterium HSG16]|nr:bifunctional chorismate mutase/prephenate dehydrogenase [Desulfobacterales bacterium HSG16]
MKDENSNVNLLLGKSRKKIDAIDEKIVALLSERQGIVENVIEIKQANNLPVFHPAREEDLISKRRLQAEALGLDPNFLEDIYRTIIRRSRVEQSATMATQGVRSGAVVLIVGGKGHMGRYFADCFTDAGYEVRILGREDWHDVDRLCAGVDLAILSVPIDQTPAIAHKLAPHLSADAVLSDLTSIKEAPVKAMMEAHSGPVVGIHPLFGSTTSTLDKQIIVATPGRDESACQWVLDQFTSWGSILLTSDAREHDEIMNIVQALRHFATFAFGRFLSQKRANLSRTLEFSSPIYRLELGMVGRLFAQDPSMYYEIIAASSERLELLKEYLVSMEESIEIIEKGDKSDFQDEFQNIARWFGPFSDQAMRESTYMINKLIERF